MALLMGLFILLNNCFQANAAALTSGVLYYLIQCCADILVGSGTVTQQQFNDMSTSEIFSTTKSALPGVNFSSLPKNPVANLTAFLAQKTAKGLVPVYTISEFAFRKFINDEQFNIATVNPELKGYGAMCFVQIYSNYFGKVDNTSVYFGSYGIIKKDVFAAIYGDKIIRQYTDNYHDLPQTEKEYSGSLNCGGVFYKDDNFKVTVKFIGDWRYPDGTTATDMLTFVQEVPASIGTVDVDGTTYDVNGDGTVTIGDETIPINDDGSVTVDDKPYYPDYDLSPYDDTAIKDLLTDILNSIDVVDDTTDDDIDDILDNVDAPAIGVDALDSMILPKAIFTVFPFCLPRDFVRGMQLFSAKPETPHFECEIKVPAFLNIPAQTWNIVIDLERFEMLARVTRWLSFISFSFLLIRLSATIVKGAH